MNQLKDAEKKASLLVQDSRKGCSKWMLPIHNLKILRQMTSRLPCNLNLLPSSVYSESWAHEGGEIWGRENHRRIQGGDGGKLSEQTVHGTLDICFIYHLGSITGLRSLIVHTELSSIYTSSTSIVTYRVSLASNEISMKYWVPKGMIFLMNWAPWHSEHCQIIDWILW